MAMTFAEWRRENSGTHADYENYLAGLAQAAAQANLAAARAALRDEADRERRDLLSAAALEHESNIAAELRRFALALADIENVHALRLTAP
jgi:hypothetical protein